MILTLNPMISASSIMEEGHLKSGLSGKTNFLMLLTANVSVRDLIDILSPKGI